ncbi:MAG: hypothetical protein HOI89_02095 [Phycisphaerae bacterium]|nr:hypothetical protein [Phycisphaerae bacterium]
MSKLRIVLSFIAAAVAMPAMASAQEYPFFVQPMTVQDVRVIADELDLSREQSLELLGQYEGYNLAFGQLQDKDVRDVMNHAMDMVMQYQWWKGEFDIPPRRQITDLVDEGLRAIRSFGRIDDDFFDSIMPLLSDAQLVQLEQERNRRAFARFDLLHRNMVGEINNGAKPDLFGILRRVELDAQTEVLVREILESYARRSIAAFRKFERSGRELIDKLLDEVDRMGLRDMDMMAMAALFADEAQQQSLKNLFDELSKPLQEASAAVSRENLRALRSLMEVLPEDARRDVRSRFIQAGYHQVGQGVAGARSVLVRLLEMREGQPEAAKLQEGIDAIDASFDSLALSYMGALNDQRNLRTMAQLEGDEPLAGADRVAGLESRRKKIIEQASAIASEFAEEVVEAESVAKDGSGGGGSGEGLSREAAIATTKSAPLTAEQVQQFGRWLGADEAATDLMVVLQGDYEMKINDLLESQGRAISKINQNTEGGWRERQAALREFRVGASQATDAIEATLFADLALALPEHIERSQIERIQTSLERSRRRNRITKDEWSIRRRGEATIDLGSLILATDPSSINGAERSAVLDALVLYDAAVVTLVDKLAERIKSAHALESRMWGPQAEEYSTEVQKAMRNRWQTRREEVEETANELAMVNRSMAEDIFASLPSEAGSMLRGAYEKAAYPEIYGSESVVDRALEEVLASDLTPEQRQKIESRTDSYRQEWQQLARLMVKEKQDQGVSRMFPPTREAMEGQLEIQRLRYRRAQLDQRTLVQIQLLLDPAQAAIVEAFVDGPRDNH